MKTNKIYISYLSTKIGKLIIGSFENKICILNFYDRKSRFSIDNRIKKKLNAVFIESESEILINTKKQIQEYLKGTRKEFNISFLLIGSDFQKLVWNELLKIPYGQTISYSELAKRINKPEAFRAVAMANSLNAIALVIPCHRVVAVNGFGGYSGGIDIKKKLLAIESLK